MVVYNLLSEGFPMNYRILVIILTTPILSYGFAIFSSLFSLPGIEQLYEKKVLALKEECSDAEQCECCTALLEKGFKWDEINAFLELPSQEQEKMMNVVMMSVRNKCEGKKILNGFTQEDRKILQKYEDLLWEKKKEQASITEEIKHAAMTDVLKEK